MLFTVCCVVYIHSLVLLFFFVLIRSCDLVRAGRCDNATTALMFCCCFFFFSFFFSMRSPRSLSRSPQNYAT